MSVEPRVCLNVLGQLRVTRAGTDAHVPAITRPRQLGLIAYLAVARPRGLHSRDLLISLFWPEADQAAGRHALRNALHGLRADLGADTITTAGDGFVGVNPERVRCDATEMDRCINDGHLEEALTYYRGELLQGFHVTGAAEFDRWMDLERRRIRDAVVGAAWALVDECQVRGDDVGALAAARVAIEADPDDETSVRKIMSLLAAAGDRGGALRHYDTFERRIRDELGVEPSSATRAAVEAVRAAVEFTPREQVVQQPPPQSAPVRLRVQVAAQRAHTRMRRVTVSGLAASLVLAAVWVVTWSATSHRQPNSRHDGVRVPHSRGESLPARYRADTALWQRYLRASAENDRNEFAAARRHFLELTHDAPLYAPAWGGLSVAMYRSGFSDMPPREAMPRALAAAQQALGMDSSLADALETNAAVSMFGRWDLPEARRRIDAALVLHPDDAELNNLLATWYRWRGDHDSALQLKLRAQALDPLSPRWGIQVAWTYYLAHRCGEAIREYRRLPREQLAEARALSGLYRSLRCAGEPDDAAATLGDVLRQSGDTDLARLFDSPLSAARRDAAMDTVFRVRLSRALAKKRRVWVPPEVAAAQYAERKQADSTLVWLDSMYIERSTLLYTVPFDPLYDFVRNDPRFVAFLQKLSWWQPPTVTGTIRAEHLTRRPLSVGVNPAPTIP